MPSRRVKPQPCKHQTLSYLCSPHFGYTEYKPLSVPELSAAARLGNEDAHGLPPGHSWTFPAPLILPGDALEDGPDEGTQNVAECLAVRNAVTSRRRTIYVCATPAISAEVELAHHVRSWTEPSVGKSRNAPVKRPDVNAVVDYLSAFYHGLPVKLLDADLRFTCWTEQTKPKAKKPTGETAKSDDSLYVGLAAGEQCTRIRTRYIDGSPFQRQLHLDDILDVASVILPKDAYAIVMLVDHDIYEGDDDDFCCGRAYGGSRISVVSTARYNPALDEAEGLDSAHAWPASHCLDFMQGQCESAGCEHHVSPPNKAIKTSRGRPIPTCDLLTTQPPDSPLHRAVTAYKRIKSHKTKSALHELWTARVCKTASHELGHCFGIAHCVFYACIMQSTSGAAEDAEQPPYLCPVDQRKVLMATGSTLTDSYHAMREFCRLRGEGAMWAAFGGWLEARLAQLDSHTIIDLT